MPMMLKDVLISLGVGLGMFGGMSPGPSVPHVEMTTGTGQEVVVGQRLTVHLQVSDSTGKEYANTKKRGLPYSFKYDEASTDPVCQWIAGMKVGGQRRLSLGPDSSVAFAQIVPSNTPLLVVVTVLRASDR